MRPVPTFLALVVAAIAGCSDPVETPTLTGVWTGTTRDRSDRWTFTFESTVSPSDLTGTVELAFTTGDSYSGTFSGTYEHPAVTMHVVVALASGTEGPADYLATLKDGSHEMEGTLVIEDRTYPLILTRNQ